MEDTPSSSDLATITLIEDTPSSSDLALNYCVTENSHKIKHSQFSHFAGHSRMFSSRSFSFCMKQVKTLVIMSIFSLINFLFSHCECFLSHKFRIIRYFHFMSPYTIFATNTTRLQVHQLRDLLHTILH